MLNEHVSGVLLLLVAALGCQRFEIPNKYMLNDGSFAGGVVTLIGTTVCMTYVKCGVAVKFFGK